MDICELNCFYAIFVVIILIVVLCFYDFYTFVVIVTIVFLLGFTCYVLVENVKSKVTDPKFIKDQFRKLKPLIEKEFKDNIGRFEEKIMGIGGLGGLETIIKNKAIKLTPEIRNELNNIKDKVKEEIEKVKLLIKDRAIESINEIKEKVKEEFDRLKDKYDKINPEIKDIILKIKNTIVEEIEKLTLE